MLIASPPGWSIEDNAAGISFKKSIGLNLISWCSVLNLVAIIFAYFDSEKSLSSKLIVNVFIFFSLILLINPTIALESIPPDKKAPKGTSAIILL